MGKKPKLQMQKKPPSPSADRLDFRVLVPKDESDPEYNLTIYRYGAFVILYDDKLQLALAAELPEARCIIRREGVLENIKTIIKALHRGGVYKYSGGIPDDVFAARATPAVEKIYAVLFGEEED